MFFGTELLPRVSFGNRKERQESCRSWELHRSLKIKVLCRLAALEIASLQNQNLYMKNFRAQICKIQRQIWIDWSKKPKRRPRKRYIARMRWGEKLWLYFCPSICLAKYGEEEYFEGKRLSNTFLYNLLCRIIIQISGKQRYKNWISTMYGNPILFA